MLDLRVGVHAHHIHVASQLLGLRARNVTRLVHVLDHTQLDTVAFALHLFRLLAAHSKSRNRHSLEQSPRWQAAQRPNPSSDWEDCPAGTGILEA
jgi:hypothetical protein